MKKIILIAILFSSTFVSAEIVKNSKGERIDLKADGTWELVNSSKSSKITNGKEFYANINDGNDKPVKIKVYSKIDNGPIRLLDEAEVIEKIRSTAAVAKIGLKNKYSFKPKAAYIEQEGTGLIIQLEYTAANSYGAEVVGREKGTYALDSKDKLKAY